MAGGDISTHASQMKMKHGRQEGGKCHRKYETIKKIMEECEPVVCVGDA